MSLDSFGPLVSIGGFFLIVVTTLGCSVYWAAFPPEDTDGISVGWHPLGILVAPFRIAVFYLRRRNVRHQRRTDGKTSVAGMVAIAGVVALVVGAVLAPTDAIRVSASTVFIYPLGIVVGYLLTNPRASGGDSGAPDAGG